MSDRHNYEYDVTLDANTAAAKVVDFVAQDKCVLEIGAGPGSITRILKANGNCKVTAIELDSSAIEKLSQHCERVYQCDLNDPEWTLSLAESGKFQVIVAADVLEHLQDPLQTLSATREILDRDGYVVVSLPHVAHHAIVACLLQEDFSYQNYGLLDRTHIRFFGIKNIQQLFRAAGYKIVAAEFVVRTPETTEFAGLWKALPKSLRNELGFNRFGTVYQVVVKAKPVSCPEKEVELLELEVPDPRKLEASYASLTQRMIRRVARIFLPYLGQETRLKIRSILDWLKIKY